MRHLSETFFVPLPLQEYGDLDYQGLQRRIGRSNRLPLKPIAILIGLLNSSVLGIVALVLRSLGLSRPDKYDYQLGELYFHVPEMAIHKRIELDAFVTQSRYLVGRCVDIGCGNGFVGGILKQMTSIAEMHGVDPVESFAHDTVVNGYDGFTCATADSTGLNSSSFDCVVSICVMEHIEDLDGALREALRLLKPGGSLVLTTPSLEFRMRSLGPAIWTWLGSRARAEAAARLRDKVSMHYHYATAEEWRNNLEHIGFDCVEVKPIFSARQLMIYEIMNWSVKVPELYFADKLWVVCNRFRTLMKCFAWSTAVVAAWVAGWRQAEVRHTHWLVSARRPQSAPALAEDCAHRNESLDRKLSRKVGLRAR